MVMEGRGGGEAACGDVVGKGEVMGPGVGVALCGEYEFGWRWEGGAGGGAAVVGLVSSVCDADIAVGVAVEEAGHGGFRGGRVYVGSTVLDNSSWLSRVAVSEVVRTGGGAWGVAGVEEDTLRGLTPSGVIPRGCIPSITVGGRSLVVGARQMAGRATAPINASTTRTPASGQIGQAAVRVVRGSEDGGGFDGGMGWRTTLDRASTQGTEADFGFAAAVRGDGGVVAVGAVFDGIKATRDGAVWLFRDRVVGVGGADAVTNGVVMEWEAVGVGGGPLIPWSPHSPSASWFGHAVAFVGDAGADVLLVGAARDQTCGGLTAGGCNGSGAVYAFGRNMSGGGGGEYSEPLWMKKMEPVVENNAEYGVSLAVAGSMVVVGAPAPEASGGEGSAFVYRWRWQGGEAGIGGTMELEDILTVAQSLGFASDVGAARRRVGGGGLWVEYVVVGAPRDGGPLADQGNVSRGFEAASSGTMTGLSNSGAVYVFAGWPGGGPKRLIARLRPATPEPEGQFGMRVSTAGAGNGVLAVGSSGCVVSVVEMW